MTSHTPEYASGKTLADKLFASFLSTAERITLKRHVLALINQHSSSFMNEEFVNEIKVIRSACELEALEEPVKQELKLDEVYNAIQRSKLITENIYTSFLASTYDSPLRFPDFNSHKLIVLLATVRLFFLGSSDGCIKPALHEIRMIGINKRGNEFVAQLPSPKLTLKEYVAELNSASQADNFVGVLSKTVTNGLRALFVCINYSMERKPGWRHHTSQGRQYKNPILIESRTIELDNNDETVLLERLHSFDNSGDEDLKQTEDFKTQIQRTTLTKVEAPPGRNRDDIEMRIQQSFALNTKLSIRKQSLSCDNSSLSEFDIQTLLTFGIKLIQEEAPQSHIVAYIFAMLLFSHRVTIKSSEELKKSSPPNFMNVLENKVSWHIYLKVATQNQPTNVFRILNRTETSITFTADHTLSRLLKTSANYNETDHLDVKPLKAFLKDVNATYGTRLTLTKIQGYFYDYVRQHNLCTVALDIISGQHDSAGIPYTNSPAHKLLKFFNGYINHLSVTSGICLGGFSTNISDDMSLGSPLKVKDEFILAYNKQCLSYLSKTSPVNSNSEQFIARHNEYIGYVWQLISLATGYRPVIGCGGSFNDYYVEGRIAYINDKICNGDISTRVIVISELLSEQLVKLRQYLTKLRNVFGVRNDPFSTRLNDSLSSANAMLFMLKEDFNPEELRPKSIMATARKFYPIATNWHRHYLSSLLRASNISPRAIDEYLGHHDEGKGIGDVFNSGTLNEQAKIAALLDKKLRELGFKAI